MKTRGIFAAWIAMSGACAGQLALERPAAVDMPVWLKVPPGNRVNAQYPFSIFTTPASFGCKAVEVRRNGQLLTKIADLLTQGFSLESDIIIGNFCSGIFQLQPHPDRLPLHLQYRFDQPGEYEVRYALNIQGGRQPTWTAWTPIDIQPSVPGARAKWLQGINAHAPSDPIELLTDFLPSILGIPDAESLQSLEPYVYNPDPRVQRFAAAGLSYWPDAEADAAVREWVRARGSNDVLDRFLKRTK